MVADNAVFLAELRLRSYKCFHDSNTVLFERGGINIIAGTNNVGKTALLRSAALQMGSYPHLSEKSKPDPGAPASGRPRLDVTLMVGKSLLPTGGSIFVPVPVQVGVVDPARTAELAGRDLTVKRPLWRGALDEKGREIHPFGPPFHWNQLQPNAEGIWLPASTVMTTESADDSLFWRLSGEYLRRTYMFHAQRYHVGSCAIGESDVLSPDARNLAEVLHTLQVNTARFGAFNRIAKRVLPSITKVSVRSVSNAFEVLVWKGPEDSDRLDLVTRLDDCGTGVGQLLALLYVVTQSPTPRTILIDEPNTFLHPGAVASLIELFKEYDQHQYIITTHSPAVIAAAEPSTLHLLTSEGYETKVHRLSSQEITDQKHFLHTVGARLEDVFGPDRLLWVEGPTEAKAFPLIAQAFKIPIARVACLPLVSTGDLEGKHARLAASIYQHMACGVALIPPACGFALDREDGSEARMKKISEAAPGKVWFLNRRMFENYLLDPGAITQLLRESDVDVSEGVVQTWFSKINQDEYDSKEQPLSETWFKNVRGDKVLGRATVELSDARLQYDKVRDGPVMVRWLLANKKEHLRELAEFIKGIVQ